MVLAKRPSLLMHALDGKRKNLLFQGSCSGATTWPIAPCDSYCLATLSNSKKRKFLPHQRARGKDGPAIVVNKQKFFLAFGKRVRELRRKHGHSQEDMISLGFSARHWQQIEAGRPITVSTLLRICDVFKTSADCLVRGLDRGIYGD
jgi:Helix-turn-helix domain